LEPGEACCEVRRGESWREKGAKQRGTTPNAPPAKVGRVSSKPQPEVKKNPHSHLAEE